MMLQPQNTVNHNPPPQLHVRIEQHSISVKWPCRCHPAQPSPGRHDLGAAVVPILPHLGYEDARPPPRHLLKARHRSLHRVQLHLRREKLNSR